MWNSTRLNLICDERRLNVSETRCIQHKSSYRMLGLGVPQKRRIRKYCKRLGTDTDKILFDDQIKSLLYKYAWTPKYIKQTIDYLNRIGYNQSKKQYARIEEQVKEGFCGENFPDHSWLKAFKETLVELKEIFGALHLTQIVYKSDQDIVDVIPKLTTHAGWQGYIINGKPRKGDNLEGIFEVFSTKLAQAKRDGTLKQPMMPGVRTQSTDYYSRIVFESLKTQDEYSENKTRTILMASLLQIINELQWSKPLQNAMHDMCWYAGGYNDCQINKRMRKLYKKYGSWISIDYSKFDVTISDWLIRAAFDVMKEAFKYDSNFDEEAWNIMVHDIICKDILLADGNLYRSTKGNPSGSMFTSMLASIVNYLCITSCLKMMQVEDYEFTIMGDDNIIFSNVDIDLTELSDMLSRNFGLIMSPSKCVSSKEKSNPVFLSREWRENGAWRAPLELVAKSLFPERWRDYRPGEGKAKPYLVLYSYILTYPLGMRDLIDVDRFLLDFPNCRNEIKELKDDRPLPGSLRRHHSELALDDFELMDIRIAA